MAIPTTTTLNPSDKGADLTLSNGNLTASGTPTGDQIVRATNAVASGKFYFEVTAAAMPGNDASAGIGLLSATASGVGSAVADSVFLNGVIYINNVQVGPSCGAYSPGGTLRVAVDVDAGRIWFSSADNQWNNHTGVISNDPATGSNGLSLSSMPGPYYPFLEFTGGQACSATVNFGATPFLGPVPAGFGPAAPVIVTPPPTALPPNPRGASTMPSIPASAIVTVTPQVISAGGTALDLSGLILTSASRVPIGTVISFPSYLTVAAYFGPTSTEANLAATYFGGFTNSNRKPGALLFAQYNGGGPVPAYLRSGNISALTLPQLQAISGTLIVTIDGVVKNATVNLSGATSFTAAAALIATALAVPVNYDPISGSFGVTSSSNGTASTMSFATGTASAPLGLTQATGAVTSQGAAVASPAAFMNAIVAINTNWACFMTTFEPLLAAKLAFAAWCTAAQNDYLYVCWDTDITATQQGTNTCAGYLVQQAGYTGVAMIYLDPMVAVFLMGSIASLDFTQRRGRATMAFRNAPGLTATVTNQVIAQNLITNGYNFYGAYATANQQFTFLYPGQVSGPFLWIDSYVDEIWMSNAFQLALINLLVQAKSIPYNAFGYALIRAACLDVINQALNFGVIRAGVTLSALQAAEVNAAAGLSVDAVLSNKGWYMQVLDALPQVRAARQSPPCTFWYMDGQSVQSIALASVEVQ